MGSARKHRASAAEMPMAGCPSAEIAAANFLFSKPAKTITATSRASRSVTRRPATNLLSMAMRLSGGKKPPAAMHDENFVALLRQRRDLARKRAHRGVVFKQCSCELDYDSH